MEGIKIKTIKRIKYKYLMWKKYRKIKKSKLIY